LRTLEDNNAYSYVKASELKGCKSNISVEGDF